MSVDEIDAVFESVSLLLIKVHVNVIVVLYSDSVFLYLLSLY